MWLRVRVPDCSIHNAETLKEHSSGKRDSSTTVGEAGADGVRLSCDRREGEESAVWRRFLRVCTDSAHTTPSPTAPGCRDHLALRHTPVKSQKKKNRAAAIKAHTTTSGGISKNASAAAAACDADPWQAQKSSCTSAPKSRHCCLCSTRQRRPAPAR